MICFSLDYKTTPHKLFRKELFGYYSLIIADRFQMKDLFTFAQIHENIILRRSRQVPFRLMPEHLKCFHTVCFQVSHLFSLQSHEASIPRKLTDSYRISYPLLSQPAECNHLSNVYVPHLQNQCEIYLSIGIIVLNIF